MDRFLGQNVMSQTENLFEPKSFYPDSTPDNMNYKYYQFQCFMNWMFWKMG